jgi:hypothetical protein
MNYIQCPREGQDLQTSYHSAQEYESQRGRSLLVKRRQVMLAAVLAAVLAVVTVAVRFAEPNARDGPAGLPLLAVSVQKLCGC